MAITPVRNKLELTFYKNSLFVDKVYFGESKVEKVKWSGLTGATTVVSYADDSKPTFNSSNIYWLYVTIADLASGGCIDYRAQFELGNNKNIRVLEVL